MAYFIGFLTILLVFISILLVFLILMQRSKSGGGLGAVAGSQTEAVFGANAGDVLSKMTAWLVVAFIVITLAVGVLSGHRTDKKSIIEGNIPITSKIEKTSKKTIKTSTPLKVDKSTKKK